MAGAVKRGSYPDCNCGKYTHRRWIIPMRRYDAIARLKEHEAELRRLGVEQLFLFGSTARDDAREDSDVDLFFDHPRGALSLLRLMDVRDAAARILGRNADIMTRASLHPVLREQIEASALRVF